MPMFKKMVKKPIALLLTLTFIMSLMTGIVAAAETTTLSADKNFYLAGDPFQVTVSGLTDEQINEKGAFVGVYLSSDKADANPYDGIEEYVREFKDLKTWNSNVPYNFSDKYEFRLCLKDNDKIQVLNRVPFEVGSKPGIEGSITMEKTSLLAGQPASVKIKNLSEGQLKDGAWVGIFKGGDAVDYDVCYNGIYTRVSELRDGETFVFNAPLEFGNYEVRVFTKNAREFMAKSFYGKVSFTVGSSTASKDAIQIKSDFYLVKQLVSVSIAGLTPEQIEDNAWVGVFPEGTSLDNDTTYGGMYTYIKHLKDKKTWEFEAPVDYGSYEIRVFTKYDTSKLKEAFYGKVSFKVGSKPANDGDLVLKTGDKYLVRNPMTVTIKGLTKEQIEDNAWAGIFTKDTAMDKDDTYKGTYVYINQLKDRMTWELEAPIDFNDYEVRVFTKNDKNQMGISFYGKMPFTVTSDPAKDGALGLKNTNPDPSLSGTNKCLVKDTVSVNITGLTKNQIEDNAWAGVFTVDTAADSDRTVNGIYTYVKELKDGNTWQFQAPTDFGDYEVRVFTKGDKNQLTKSLYGKLPFSVISNPAKDGDLLLENENPNPGLKDGNKSLITDTLSVTIKGLTTEQINDNAWAGVFNPTDALDTSPIGGKSIYVKELRNGAKWSFNAPVELGKYEVRIFTKGSKKIADLEKSLYGKLPFEVVSLPANKGDLKINKQFYNKQEPVSVTITNLTKGQISNGAWAGVYKLTDTFNATPLNGLMTSVGALRDGKTWTFTQSLDPGKYEVRIFTQNVKAENRESVLYGRLPFTIQNISTVVKTTGAFNWNDYSLKVTPSGAVSLKVGQSFKIKATAVKGSLSIPVNNLVKFKCDSKLVTISKDGTVTCKSAGTVSIIIIVDNQPKKNQTIKVTIKAK